MRVLIILQLCSRLGIFIGWRNACLGHVGVLWSGIVIRLCMQWQAGMGSGPAAVAWHFNEDSCPGSFLNCSSSSCCLQTCSGCEHRQQAQQQRAKAVMVLPSLIHAGSRSSGLAVAISFVGSSSTGALQQRLRGAAAAAASSKRLLWFLQWLQRDLPVAIPAATTVAEAARAEASTTVAGWRCWHQQQQQGVCPFLQHTLCAWLLAVGWGAVEAVGSVAGSPELQLAPSTCRMSECSVCRCDRSFHTLKHCTNSPCCLLCLFSHPQAGV